MHRKLMPSVVKGLSSYSYSCSCSRIMKERERDSLKCTELCSSFGQNLTGCKARYDWLRQLTFGNSPVHHLKAVVNKSSSLTRTVAHPIAHLIHSFILAISIAPLQVHYYSEALLTQFDYCVS